MGDRSRNELVIRVLSTFGNPHLCGLTEIELFDSGNEKIALLPSNLEIRNLGNGARYLVDKLISGNKLTIDDKQMWIGYLPKPPQKLELVVYFNKDTVLGGIKLWNYNKSILDYTKCVKEVEIILNDDTVWNGCLIGGKGKIDEDYSTSISLI